MRKYVLLTRASTEEQGRGGNSHNTQRNAALNSNRVKNWSCESVISETISGTVNERKTYEQLYRKCIRRPDWIDLILIQKWSRFARNQTTAWHWITKFRKIGVEINAADQWIDYENGAANTMLGIYLGIAADESERISKFTTDNIQDILSQGFYAYPATPRGWEKVLYKETKRKTLNPSECYDAAKHVLLEYNKDLYSQAYLRKKYAKDLGLRKSAFNRFLFNPTHAGLIHLKPYRERKSEEYIKGKWYEHRMLEQNEFFENLQIRKQRERTPIQSAVSVKNYDRYFLKGLFFSAKSGKRMTASASTSRSGSKHHYYHSATKGESSLKVSDCHELIYEVLQTVFSIDAQNPILKKALTRQSKEGRKSAKTKLTEVKKRLEKIAVRQSELKDLFSLGEIGMTDYLELKKTTEQTKRKIELELADAQKSVDASRIDVLGAVEKFSQIGERFKKASYEVKAQLLRQIFPEGFTLDLEQRVVRTTTFAKFLLLIVDNQQISAKIKTDKQLKSPFVRGWVDTRSDLEPTAQILTFSNIVKKMIA